jgi:hypothetical protein
MDVLSRTRRNADTIRGAAPDITVGRPAAVCAGARPYHGAASSGSGVNNQHLEDQIAALSGSGVNNRHLVFQMLIVDT